MTPTELELIEAFMDDRLPETESDSLRELLRNNPSARAYLRSLATVDSGLRDLAFTPPELQDLDSSDESDFAADRPHSRPFKSQQARRKRAPLFFPSRIIIAAAAVVAGIAIIFTLFDFNLGQSEKYVATVERISNNAQLSSQIVPGKRIGTAPIEIESGILNLRFDSGAVITLHGPARFIPVDERGGTLEYGIVIGQAPKDHKGLRIVGPNFDVTDLGTEFALKVDKEKGAELFVIEGSVALTPHGGEQVIVKRDDGYRIDPNNMISVMNEEQMRDVFGKILLTRRDPLGIITPDTVALFSFAGNQPDAWRELVTDTPIPAAVAADQQSGAAILNYSNNIKMRDRADLLIDPPLSFEARIYIEPHDGKDGILFADRDQAKDNMRGWAVHIKQQADESFSPIFTYYPNVHYEFPQAKLPFGRWTHIMFTVDENVLRLFINGELQGESLREGRIKMGREGTVYIGGAMRYSKPSDSIMAKVAYIAIHKRVLSTQEIQNRLTPADQP